MEKLKVLNLYAGIGGNRKLWENVDVTAVEIDPQIAAIYQDYFPDDKMVVGDAHQYLLDHFQEFDFIWTSPPCPTHSKARKQLAIKSWGIQNKPVYPDMTLYQEILFLDGYFEGKYCVENVVSWYDPLIKCFEVDSHYFWTNFVINEMPRKPRGHDSKINDLAINKGFDLETINGVDKRKVLRNAVNSETGLYILNCARNIITKSNVNQLDIFEDAKVQS